MHTSAKAAQTSKFVTLIIENVTETCTHVYGSMKSSWFIIGFILALDLKKWNQAPDSWIMIFSVYVVLAPPIGKIPLNINFIYIAHIHNSSYFSAFTF